MNREAIRWIEMLETPKLDDDGKEVVDWNLRMKIFSMAQDWLIRSRKLWPDSSGADEGAGITDMRDWMNNPAMLEQLDAMMVARGYVKVPAKKNGRPTKAEAAVRANFKAAVQTKQDEIDADDGSGLAALMKGKIPGKPQ